VITRRGWAVLAASATLGVAGRLLGLGELYGLAGAGLGLMLAGLIVTRQGTNRVALQRRITPKRVHVGSPWRVELIATNNGTLRSPLLSVSTTFASGQRYARFMLAPLDANASVEAAFRLPTDKRGVFTLGPLLVERSDIFSLVARRTTPVPATKLTVYPRIDDVTSMDGVGVADPLAEMHGPRRIGSSGGDFYALVEYEQGDDLRRVHWPSVARTGELMIRQDETPWRGRTTVIVDIRSEMHDDDSFEDALSAAASVVVAGGARNGLVRLVTTGSYDSGFGAGHAHVDHLLEVLALAKPKPGELGALAALRGVAKRNSATGATRGGPCVITTSRGVRELGPFLTRDEHAVGVVFTFGDEKLPSKDRGRRRQVLTVPVNSRGFATAWANRVVPGGRRRPAVRSSR